MSYDPKIVTDENVRRLGCLQLRSQLRFNGYSVRLKIIKVRLWFRIAEP